MTNEILALPDSVVLVRDVEYGTGSGRPLKLQILRPRTRRATVLPAVVWIHGGGWRQGSPLGRTELLIPLVDQDVFVAAIEYRLSQEALFPAQIEDCKCAIRYLRAHAARYGIDPERIGVWGSSAGGHLAALLGTSASARDLEGGGGWSGQSSRVQAVACWYGIYDLSSVEQKQETLYPLATQLIGGAIEANQDKALKASPITYVSAGCPPFLIMHGTEDTTVPPAQSQLLHDALQRAGAPSELVMVPGKGHEPLGDAALAQVQAFFARHLLKS